MAKVKELRLNSKEVPPKQDQRDMIPNGESLDPAAAAAMVANFKKGMYYP